jgi:thiol-disulfide isomerase/thioredoxin
MKQYAKYFLLASILFAVLVFAFIGYNYLADRYLPEEAPVSDSSEEKAETADDFTVLDINGNEVKLSDNFGKPIVVNFWATWCGPCKSELPAFENIYKENKDDVVFMMVNLTDGYRETTDTVKDFISQGGYTFPVYFDTSYDAADAYRVNSIPMSLFIDKNGNLVKKQVGAMSESSLKQYINRITQN